MDEIAFEQRPLWVFIAIIIIITIIFETEREHVHVCKGREAAKREGEKES